MSHEINQLDIPDHQLQAGTSQSKGVWTEIGEAEITYTVFGNARVRIIRKQDKVRRTLWLTATGGLVLAAMVWQVWFSSQQAQPQQSADPASVLSVGETGSAPLPTEIKQPAISQHSVQQQSGGLDGAGKIPAKRARPVAMNKAQTDPLVAATPSIAQPVLNRPEPATVAKEGTSASSLADVNQAAPSASAQP